MPYFLVQDFKLGLDSRRNELTSPAGSLMKCKNAHISRGGEVEKRNCFEKITDIPGYLHGFDVTGDGLYVFADRVGQSDGSTWNSIKAAGIDVLIVEHPRGSGWTINQVMWSTIFDGKLFSIVRFVSDNDANQFETYCYYDERKEFVATFSSGPSVLCYKPTIVTDTFYGLAGYGILNPNLITTASFASELLTSIKRDPDFINSTVGTGSKSNEITIVGLDEKEFVLEASRLSDSKNYLTCTPTVVTKEEVQAAVVGTPVGKATAAFAVASGSEGRATFGTSARVYPGNVFLMKITQLLVDGDDIAYVNLNDPITYVDNDQTHLYGSEVMAGAIANHINANTSTSGYTATFGHDGDWYGWNGTGFVSLYITGPAVNPTDYNGKEVWVELDNTFAEIYAIGSYHRSYSAFVNASTAVVSTVSKPGAIATNPEGTLKLVRFGLYPTFSGGIDNSISSIIVDSTEILGSRVSWTSSNSGTMVSISDRINNFQNQYDSKIENSVIIITHKAGGSSTNGKFLGITKNGNVVVNNLRHFSGGSESSGQRPQKNKITIGTSNTELVGRGTRVEINTKYDSDAIYKSHAASDITGIIPTFTSVYKSKVHLVAGQTVFFSALNEPMSWDPQKAGAGFVNFSNNFSSKYDIVSLSPYRASLSIFAPSNIQIWGWDPNPELNAQSQVLSNTGALTVGSVVELGDIDVFYVSSSGIRSLKSRDNTDSATSLDVGTQIDTLIQKEIKDAGLGLNISSVIEPNSGRYMMSINNKIYVLSQFTGSQIQSWSTYEPNLGNIEKLVSSNSELYMRLAGSVFKLSKENYTNSYDANISEVVMPYLDGQKPAHTKTFTGIDSTIEGTWQVYAGTNTSNTSAIELVATISSPTFQLGRIAMVGIGTHMGVTMVSPPSNSPSTIGNLMIHYRLDKAD